MRPYIHKDFLLSTPAARELYHRFGEGQPIFDFHCHLSPQEIREDQRFETITQVWLSGDHYKWRLMRANGVPEELITGDGDPYEKFLAWARTVEKSVGNPLYAWTHMELKNYFGVEELLSEKTAPAIWQACNEKLQEPGFSARGLIVQSNVKALCTTDDPVDTLEHHAAISADESFPVQVLPAFRPETALHPEQANFRDWVSRLGQVTGKAIASLRDLEEALSQRAFYFKERGCLIADQSLQSPDFTVGTRQQAEAAFIKALSGEALSPAEQNAYQTQLLISLGKK